MSKIAFLFPGQGAQYPGMGRDIYQKSPAAKIAMDSIQSLRPGTLETCFEGSLQTLTSTENAQPCLFTVSAGIVAALGERGIAANMCAGFSFGELFALYYAKAYNLQTALSLVARRSVLMHRAASAQNCCMAAVLKLSAEQTQQICSQIPGAYAVNFNAPGQTVVACNEDSLAALNEKVQAAGGRTIKLSVSGGFHSPYMDEPAEQFKLVLGGIDIAAAGLPVYSNRTAFGYPNQPEQMKELLSKQINSPVLWERTLKNMYDAGARVFVEAGAGRVLSGLVAKTLPDAVAVSAQDFDSVELACKKVMETKHA